MPPLIAKTRQDAPSAHPAQRSIRAAPAGVRAPLLTATWNSSTRTVSRISSPDTSSAGASVLVTIHSGRPTVSSGWYSSRAPHTSATAT